MADQRWRNRIDRPRIESRTIAGHTVWVRRDVFGIAMLSDRREDVDPAPPAR